MRKLLSFLITVLLFTFISACSAKSQPAEIDDETLFSETLSPAQNIPLTSTSALPAPQLTIGTTIPNPTDVILSLTPTSVAEITNEPEMAETPEQTALQETEELPEEHYIYNISGHKQYFPLGCETSAAIDWATYFGYEINEFEFQTRLPLSENPDFGFVGSVESPWGQTPPYGYGVHAYPVADLLNEYGIKAVGVKDFTIEQIKEQVAQNRPVIAWVIGNCVGGIPAEYTDSQGNTTIVAAYEHVIIVTGYSADNIRYMNNGKFYEVPVEVFENSWSVLQKMVIYLESIE